MTTTQQILSTISDEVQAIVAALVGGARYGVKIRLPHALVMTMLFRRDLTSKQKLNSVVKMAMEHASNLAAFASIYKVQIINTFDSACSVGFAIHTNNFPFLLNPLHLQVYVESFEMVITVSTFSSW